MIGEASPLANNPHAQTLHDFLLQHAVRLGHTTAVVEVGPSGEIEETSYSDLVALARRYEDGLRRLGLGLGDRVILEAETSVAGIAMLLACSSLGIIFIPVTPDTLDARLTAIVDAAEPTLFLQWRHRPGAEFPSGMGVARYGNGELDVVQAPGALGGRGRTPVPTDPAYIVFTSGTTGRPKGVVMSHRSILAFYRSLLQEQIVAEGGRVASTAPFHFDFALLDIALALGSGAAVAPVPRTWVWQPARFVRFLKDAKVTQINGAPSIWPPVLHHVPGDLAQLADVRGVLYSGEAFPLSELRKLKRALPRARIVNCFGSTESVACSFTTVPDEIGPDVTEIPIGPAHAGAAMVLIDDDGGRITGPGQVGEIFLHSPALFTCYWDDPETTSRTLVPDPLNTRSGQLVFRTGDRGRYDEHGRVFFCGRADHLVKIRGNRVELGDVENCISGLAGVDAVTVLALPVEAGVLALFAFVVSTVVDERAVRSRCEERLPTYMVPLEVHIGSELPVTSNGKTDLRALAELAGRAE